MILIICHITCMYFFCELCVNKSLVSLAVVESFSLCSFILHFCSLNIRTMELFGRMVFKFHDIYMWINVQGKHTLYFDINVSQCCICQKRNTVLVLCVTYCY
jgi:hypothetical protein